jgi:cysteine synthase
MMAAVKGYKTIFIMPDKMSAEKVSTLARSAHAW